MVYFVAWITGTKRGGGWGNKASGVKIPPSPSHSALVKEAMLKKV